MGELTPVSGASVCIISIQILALKSRSNEPQQHILASSVSVFSVEYLICFNCIGDQASSITLL